MPGFGAALKASLAGGTELTPLRRRPALHCAGPAKPDEVGGRLRGRDPTPARRPVGIGLSVRLHHGM